MVETSWRIRWRSDLAQCRRHCAHRTSSASLAPAPRLTLLSPRIKILTADILQHSYAPHTLCPRPFRSPQEFILDQINCSEIRSLFLKSRTIPRIANSENTKPKFFNVVFDITNYFIYLICFLVSIFPTSANPDCQGPILICRLCCSITKEPDYRFISAWDHSKHREKCMRNYFLFLKINVTSARWSFVISTKKVFLIISAPTINPTFLRFYCFVIHSHNDYFIARAMYGISWNIYLYLFLLFLFKYPVLQ